MEGGNGGRGRGRGREPTGERQWATDLRTVNTSPYFARLSLPARVKTQVGEGGAEVVGSFRKEEE